MSAPTLTFRRFLSADTFVSNLRSLRVFGSDYVNIGLLEELEGVGLLIARRRLHFPPEVARRLWYEDREGTERIAGPLEPDGAKWESALALWDSLFRWRNRSIYGSKMHPLDVVASDNSGFISIPAAESHRPWDEFRVDVSCDFSLPVFSSSYTESYYAPWQLLVAAEISNVGVFYRINLLDRDMWDKARECVFEKKAPAKTAQFRNEGCAHARFLSDREHLLDAVVWFAEECDFALNQVLPRVSGRYRLTHAQNEQYLTVRRQLAQQAARRFGVQEDDLVVLVRHLIDRWADWTRDGRPLIAEAYKTFSAQAVHLAMLAFGVPYEQLKHRLGDKFTVIWPNWADAQTKRLSLTLRAALKDSAIDRSRIDEFASFLVEHRLESFYWRLLSFEDQLFRGNEFSFGGLRSDLQGLAISLEHVVRKLGGAKGQLIEMFKQLWQRRDVADLMTKHTWVARKGADVLSWEDFKTALDEVRKVGPAGPIVADLLMAQRIRGTVHFSFPLDDDFEVEQLFVGLIRAAYATYVEARTNAI